MMNRWFEPAVDSLPPVWGDIVVLALMGVVAVGSYFALKGMLYLLDHMVRRTPTEWDDDMLNHRFHRAVAQLAPALLVNWMLPGFFDDTTSLHHWCRVLTSFYIVWAVVHLVNVSIMNLYNAMARRPMLHTFAIKGVFQMARLISIGVGAIVALSIVVGKSPVAIVTAIGASAAVLMLVFRDTILGLVASIQLTANEMLRRGDWITAPKYDVNGEVEDVSLTTVKVRNWDNSVSTIPPYSLISDSFRNYQAMRTLGGRRIERSVTIDVDSVGFLDSDTMRRMCDAGLVTEADAKHHSVNLTLLRRYLERYITSVPTCVDEMLHMVRQLEPTPQGIPLQVYFFTSVTEWKGYEEVMADFMDHVYATVPLFGLRIYQAPSGGDVRTIRGSGPLENY